MVNLDPAADPGLRVNEDHPDCRDPVDNRVDLALQDKEERLGHLDLPDNLAHKVRTILRIVVEMVRGTFNTSRSLTA